MIEVWADQDWVVIQEPGKFTKFLKLEEAVQLASLLPEAIRSASQIRYYGNGLKDAEKQLPSRAPAEWT